MFNITDIWTEFDAHEHLAATLDRITTNDDLDAAAANDDVVMLELTNPCVADVRDGATLVLTDVKARGYGEYTAQCGDVELRIYADRTRPVVEVTSDADGEYRGSIGRAGEMYRQVGAPVTKRVATDGGHPEGVTHDDVTDAVAERVDVTLADYINPWDVDEDADTWTDVDRDTLRYELHCTAKVMVSEGQQDFDNLVAERAATRHRDGLTRAPLDHLTADTHAEAVEMGYWPHGITRWQALALVYDTGATHPDARDAAHEEVTAAVATELHPTRSDVEGGADE